MDMAPFAARYYYYLPFLERNPSPDTDKGALRSVRRFLENARISNAQI
jgi:hypothetical protein